MSEVHLPRSRRARLLTLLLDADAESPDVLAPKIEALYAPEVTDEMVERLAEWLYDNDGRWVTSHDDWDEETNEPYRDRYRDQAREALRHALSTSDQTGEGS